MQAVFSRARVPTIIRARARPRPGTGSITIRSRTGYFRRYSLAEAGRALLAHRVRRSAALPLRCGHWPKPAAPSLPTGWTARRSPPGHGFPARMVEPPCWRRAPAPQPTASPREWWNPTSAATTGSSGLIPSPSTTPAKSGSRPCPCLDAGLCPRRSPGQGRAGPGGVKTWHRPPPRAPSGPTNPKSQHPENPRQNDDTGPLPPANPVRHNQSMSGGEKIRFRQSQKEGNGHRQYQIAPAHADGCRHCSAVPSAKPRGTPLPWASASKPPLTIPG